MVTREKLHNILYTQHALIFNLTNSLEISSMYKNKRAKKIAKKHKLLKPEGKYIKYT